MFGSTHPLNGTAPSYLADELHRSADSEARQRLRSASSSRHLCPPYTSLNRRWPSLPGGCSAHASNPLSPLHFRFSAMVWSLMYPGVTTSDFNIQVVPAQWLCHVGHFIRSFYLLTCCCCCLSYSSRSVDDHFGRMQRALMEKRSEVPRSFAILSRVQKSWQSTITSFLPSFLTYLLTYLLLLLLQLLLCATPRFVSFPTRKGIVS